MKKLLAVILAVTMLLPAIALADLPDISGLSDQELKDLISACSQELMSRNKSESEDTLLFEYEDVRVYQAGKPSIDRLGYLTIPVTVYNDMDHEMVITPEDVTCNGWDIFATNCRATGNSKNKDELKFKVSDANVKSIDKIDSLLFRWEVIDFTEFDIVYTQEEREEHRFW